MTYYVVSRIVRRSLPILSLTAVIAIMSGRVLEGYVDILTDQPTFLVLIPALIKISGDLGSTLGARLSTALHIGLVRSDLSALYSSVIRNNVIAIYLSGIISSLTLSIIVWVITLDLSWIILAKVSLFTSAIQLFIITAVAISIAFISHRYGIDPDDIVIPIVATLSDLLGIVFIVTAIGLFALL